MRHLVRLVCSLCLLTGCVDSDPPREDVPKLQAAAVAAVPQYGSVVLVERPETLGGSLANSRFRLSTARAMLPQLQGRNLAIVLVWPSTKLADSDYWNFVRDARAHNIEIRPSLILPDGDAADDDRSSANFSRTGRFLNATNYQAWIAASKDLAGRWETAFKSEWQAGDTSKPLGTMFVDLEPRVNRLRELSAALKSGDLTRAITALDDGKVSDELRKRQTLEYDQALAALKDYVDWLHAHRFKAHMSSLLMMLQDYEDNDIGFRLKFGVPINNAPNAPDSVAWDRVSFQIHRTLYQQGFPKLTPYFVYYYAQMAKKFFGDKAGIDVGLTEGGVEPDAKSYQSPSELRDDAAAAMAAGIARDGIGVFSLLGILVRPGDLEPWFQPAPLPLRAPPADQPTMTLHDALWAADLVINGRDVAPGQGK